MAPRPGLGFAMRCGHPLNGHRSHRQRPSIRLSGEAWRSASRRRLKHILHIYTHIFCSFVACLLGPFNKSGEVAEPRISLNQLRLFFYEECEDMDPSQYRDAIYRPGVSLICRNIAMPFIDLESH